MCSMVEGGGGGRGEQKIRGRRTRNGGKDREVYKTDGSQQEDQIEAERVDLKEWQTKEGVKAAFESPLLCRRIKLRGVKLLVR